MPHWIALDEIDFSVPDSGSPHERRNFHAYLIPDFFYKKIDLIEGYPMRHQTPHGITECQFADGGILTNYGIFPVRSTPIPKTYPKTI
uniref:Transposase n=1 Tax=Steinernema glaseri TaxID=37863 RepID=A0A1I8AGU2_9BILA